MSYKLIMAGQASVVRRATGGISNIKKGTFWGHIINFR
nr:MAG TPA: hypothetical protein [Caudoviricetes sp.]